MKHDMSKTCGAGYEQARVSMSDEEFHTWFETHCEKCIHCSEVCMYDERLEESK